jgi:hypothetical protein
MSVQMDTLGQITERISGGVGDSARAGYNARMMEATSSLPAAPSHRFFLRNEP